MLQEGNCTIKQRGGGHQATGVEGGPSTFHNRQECLSLAAALLTTLVPHVYKWHHFREPFRAMRIDKTGGLYCVRYVDFNFH